MTLNFVNRGWTQAKINENLQFRFRIRGMQRLCFEDPVVCQGLEQFVDALCPSEHTIRMERHLL